jgi:uncharacterized phiE125 gp8 family phage protein
MGHTPAPPIFKMNTQYKVTTAPATEPISLSEAKSQCRIESSFTDDDTWLNTAIQVVREQAEGLTNRAIIDQTITMVADGFDGGFEVPQPPLGSVTSITYYDEDNALQTLATSEYQVNNYAEPAIISPAYEATWPATYSRFDAVKVVFQSGYANAAAVPTSLKQGMLMMLTDLYDNRSQEGDPNGRSIIRKSALNLISMNKTQNYVS